EAPREAATFAHVRLPTALRLLFAIFLLGGCHDNEDSTTCNADSDCGSGGACLVAPVSKLDFCADIARGCETGRRWSGSAGDQLAGLCVAPQTIDAGVDALVDAPPADAP